MRAPWDTHPLASSRTEAQTRLSPCFYGWIAWSIDVVRVELRSKREFLQAIDIGHFSVLPAFRLLQPERRCSICSCLSSIRLADTDTIFICDQNYQLFWIIARVDNN